MARCRVEDADDEGPPPTQRSLVLLVSLLESSRCVPMVRTVQYLCVRAAALTAPALVFKKRTPQD